MKVAEIFKFFNSAPGDERWHYASDFADYFGNVLSSGLLHKNGTPNLQVKVNAGTMQTYVEAGEALIQGYQYQNTTPLFLTHGLPEPSLDRIDRIVLRLDKRNNARHIKLFVKEGVSATNPEPPALQRDQYVFELSLAQIRLTKNTSSLEPLKLIDERMKEDLCGIVYSLISVPTSVFQQQWDYWFNLKKQTLEDDLVAWQLQQKNDFETWQAIQEQDFLTWIESIKDILDENVAANLAAKIAELEQSVDTLEQTVNSNSLKIDNHIKDDLGHVWYVGAGGTLNAISVTSDKIILDNASPPKPKQGSAYRIFSNFTNTGNVTLKVSDGVKVSNAIPLLRSNGTQIPSGAMISGGIYTVAFNGTNFILQGEGGGYGVSEQIPLDKLQCELVNASVTLVFNDLTDAPSFSPAQSIYYDYNNLEYHVLGNGGYKTFGGNGALKRTLALNTTSYAFAFDEEHGFIYLSYSSYRLAKVNARTQAIIWETPSTSNPINVGSVACIPNNQGVVIAVSSTNSFELTAYNKDGGQKWKINYNYYVGVHRSICVDRAGNVYLAVQNNDNNQTVVYKFNGVTGVAMVGPIVLAQGYYTAHRMMVDETNGRVIILLSDGNIRSLRTSDLGIVYSMSNTMLTSGGMALDIDKKGNVYIGNRNGNVNLYTNVAPGVVKFSPTLSYMWRMGNIIMQYPGDISIALDKNPAIEYPDFVIALPKTSGYTTSTVRYRQTLTIKS